MRNILAAALLVALPMMAVAGEAPTAAGKSINQPPRQPGERLSAAEVTRLLAGNSTKGSIVLDSPLLGHVYQRFFAADGRLFSRNLTKKDADTGSWRVDDSGEVCMKHASWAGSREYCTHVERTGNSSYTRVFKGQASELMTVSPGDAFGLGG